VEGPSLDEAYFKLNYTETIEYYEKVKKTKKENDANLEDTVPKDGEDGESSSK